MGEEGEKAEAAEEGVAQGSVPSWRKAHRPFLRPFEAQGNILTITELWLLRNL